MKALSIRQPYATLIATGLKDVENRSYKTNFRGKIYIHASAKWHERLKVNGLFTTLQLKEIGKKFEDLAFAVSLITPDVANSLPLSFIIGEVELYDCIINSKSIWAEPGQFHWCLRNAIMYDEPIFAKGKLGFWNFEKK